MVKKIFLFFAYLLFFIAALIYFAPKSSIYYFLETQLKEYEVVVSSEEVLDRGFIFEITHANLSVKSIRSANITKTDIKIFALYNSIDIEGVTLSSTAKSFVPLHIENIHIEYSILDPLRVVGYAVGGFGEIDALFSIVEMALHLDLKPSKIMLKNHRNTLRNLKKDENGGFVYDKAF